jgi:hypothetical protein
MMNLSWHGGIIGATTDYAVETTKQEHDRSYHYKQDRLCPLCWLDRVTTPIFDTSRTCKHHWREMKRIEADVHELLMTQWMLIRQDAPKRCWWWRWQ